MQPVRGSGAFVGEHNLLPVLHIVSDWIGYSFEESDWLAVHAGVFQNPRPGEDLVFDYPLVGVVELTARVWVDDGGALSVGIFADPVPADLAARLEGLLDVAEQFDLVSEQFSLWPRVG